MYRLKQRFETFQKLQSISWFLCHTHWPKYAVSLTSFRFGNVTKYRGLVSWAAIVFLRASDYSNNMKSSLTAHVICCNTKNCQKSISRTNCSVNISSRSINIWLLSNDLYSAITDLDFFRLRFLKRRKKAKLRTYAELR